MPVQVTRLPSGLTVATESMPNIETASVQIWVHAGSRLETTEESGIAHVLEHMAFKGTTRRSAVAIKEEMADVGGFIAAATSNDDTIYSARVLKADVPLALDILSDILIYPLFDQTELTREEEVIVQEIAARRDSPNGATFENLLATAFAGQPLGRPIAGTAESVRSFDRARLVGYRGRTYHAPNVVVSAAGAVDHEAIVADAGARLAAFPPVAVDKPVAAHFSPGVVNDARGIEQMHLAIAFAGLGVPGPARRSLQIFAHVLGGGMSSRLFHEVREKRGLCYSVGSAHWEWSDAGLFVLYAATDPERVAALADVVAAEALTAADAITPAEVARSKAQFKSGVLMGMEAPDGRASSMAHELFTRGRTITLDEFARELDAVTVESVRAAGRAALTGTPPAVSVVGPQAGIDRVPNVAALFAR